jgi:hypothetical protein
MKGGENMLYFDSKCNEGWNIEDVEKIRESALRLVYQNMHPRYDLVVKDLFKASNALLNEMKLDQSRSFSTSIEEQRHKLEIDDKGFFKNQ